MHYVCAGTQVGQKMALDPLKLELWAVVTYQIWVIRNKPRSSVTVTRVLSRWAIFLAPATNILKLHCYWTAKHHVPTILATWEAEAGGSLETTGSKRPSSTQWLTLNHLRLSVSLSVFLWLAGFLHLWLCLSLFLSVGFFQTRSYTSQTGLKPQTQM